MNKKFITHSQQSKTALSTYGSLHITIMFSIMEDKGRNRVKVYKSDGQSRYYTNVKEHYIKMRKDASYNAIKREFPTRSVTPYNIIMIAYHFIYLVHRYQIVEKNNKYYERFRVTAKKRTKYIRIKDAYTNPDIKLNR